MFELADRLVGIYKTNDATKSVTINPKKFQSIGNCASASMTSASASMASVSTSVVPAAPSPKMASSDMMVATTTTDAPRSILGDATNRL